MVTKRRPRPLVAFRLPQKTLDRLDAFARRLARERPGLSINRTDALLVLLERALAGEEENHGKEEES